jgi:hypothetical protein
MVNIRDSAAMPPSLAAAVDRFDAVYAEWLAARANLAAKHDDDDSDAATQRRADREREAHLALATAPAPLRARCRTNGASSNITRGLKIEDGPSKYSILTIALASLSADISALGLKPWPED